METLGLISIILGFIGCGFVIFSFICQLYEIYKTKNAKGTSWGLIISQIFTCISFGASAGINVYLGNLISLPFLVANTGLIILFIIMSLMKYSYDKNTTNLEL